MLVPRLLNGSKRWVCLRQSARTTLHLTSSATMPPWVHLRREVNCIKRGACSMQWRKQMFNPIPSVTTPLSVRVRNLPHGRMPWVSGHGEGFKRFLWYTYIYIITLYTVMFAGFKYVPLERLSRISKMASGESSHTLRRYNLRPAAEPQWRKKTDRLAGSQTRCHNLKSHGLPSSKLTVCYWTSLSLIGKST